MIDEVAENIFRIPIPLTVPLLDSMNAYVIRDPERSLIVDTGMMQMQCKDAMMAGLAEIGVTLDKADFFMTHYHGDHFGLVSLILADEAVIHMSEPDVRLLELVASQTIIGHVAHFLELAGFPEKDPRNFIPEKAGAEYMRDEPWPFRLVKDGDIIEKGGHRFRCVVTPGHTAGHTCLYDEKHRILVAGDHLLANITPAIQLRSDDENPLADYQKSLETLQELDVNLVLPGHGRTFRNYRERMKQIARHHEERAEEVLHALRLGEKDSYQVASLIPWSIVDFEGWEGVPVIQKFFATGEAFSHLKFLEEKGTVRKRRKGQRLVYSLPA